MGYEEYKEEVEDTLERWDRITTIVPNSLAKIYIDIEWARDHQDRRNKTKQEFNSLIKQLGQAQTQIASESKRILSEGVATETDLTDIESALNTGIDAVKESNELDTDYLLDQERTELITQQNQLNRHIKVAEHSFRFATARRARFKRGQELESRLEELEDEIQTYVSDTDRIEYTSEQLDDFQTSLTQIMTDVGRYEDSIDRDLPSEAKKLFTRTDILEYDSPDDHLNFETSPSAGRLREWCRDLLDNIRHARSGAYLAKADAALSDAVDAFSRAYQDIDHVEADRKAIQSAIETTETQLENAREHAPEDSHALSSVEAKWVEYRDVVSKVESTDDFAEKLQLCDDCIADFRDNYSDYRDHSEPTTHLAQSEIDSLQELLDRATKYCNDSSEAAPSIANDMLAYDERVDVRRSEIAELQDKLKTHNEEYATHLAERYPEVFTDVEGNNLNDRQRKAVIASEDRVLISAPAGTGKTKTIDHRVKYLINVDGVAAETVLATGFANATVDELEQRITAPGVRCETVDALGKRITEGIYPGYRLPDGSGSPSEIIAKELFRQKLNSDSKFYDSDFERHLARLKRHWVPVYDRASPEEVEDSRSEPAVLDRIEYYLETHGFEVSRSNPIREVEGMSGEGEYVADFYLNEFDIVISHVPVLSNPYDENKSDLDPRHALDAVAQRTDPELHESVSKSLEELRAEIEWEQRRFSELDGYNIIFTYGWENQENTLLQHLEYRLMEQLAIPLPIVEEEFVEAHSGDKTNSELEKKVRDTVVDAVAMARTRGVPTNNQSSNSDSKVTAVADGGAAKTIQQLYPTGSPLYKAFADVLSILYNDYDRYREDRKYLDFIEAKLRAAEHLLNDTDTALLNQYDFKYIIVDEFQDISPPDMTFLDALARSNDAQLFCVGDDWQSIYGFRGTTPEYFLDFESHFDSKANIITLNKTYRNPQTIVNASTELISNNSEQREKDISAALEKEGSVTIHKTRKSIQDKTAELVETHLDREGHEGSGDTSPTDIMIIAKLSKQLDELVSILYEHGIPAQKKKSVDDSLADDKVVTTTAHRAKGDSAQHVIVYNAVDDEYGGFPDTRKGGLTAPVEPERSNTFESERRLFYVALTRTKRTVDIVTKRDKSEQSRFIRELRPDFQELQDGENSSPRLGRAELSRIAQHGIWNSDHRVIENTPLDGHTAQSLVEHAASETETGVAMFQFCVELIIAANERMDRELDSNDVVDFYYWYVSEADSYFADSDETMASSVENALAPFIEPIKEYNMALRHGLDELFDNCHVSQLLNVVDALENQPLLNDESKPPEFNDVIRTYGRDLEFETQSTETVVEALELVASSLSQTGNDEDARRIQNCANFLQILQTSLEDLYLSERIESVAHLRWRLPAIEAVGQHILDEEDMLHIRELKRLSRIPELEIIAAASTCQ